MSGVELSLFNWPTWGRQTRKAVSIQWMDLLNVNLLTFFCLNPNFEDMMHKQKIGGFDTGVVSVVIGLA